MEHNKPPVGENEPSTEEDVHGSVEDIELDKLYISISELDKIWTIEGSKAEIDSVQATLLEYNTLKELDKIWTIEGSKAEIDSVEAINTTPNKNCKGQMDEKNEKNVEKNEENITSILHDSDDKKNARRMETYVSFVNSNWKETLTKFNKKNQNLSKDEKNINKVSEKATGSSKSCSTPEGLLHSMWLHSLAKGDVVIEKELPRKKSPSPYLIFCKEKEKELSHLTWKEFGLITRKEWKEIGDKEKEKYKEKCKELRDKEREKYQGKVNETTEKKKTKIKLENVAKKRLKKPRSAFSIYMDSLTSEVSMKEGDNREDAEDVKKQANNQWRRLNKKEKDIFKAKAQEEWTLVQQMTDVEKVETKEDDPVVEAVGRSIPNICL